MRTPKDHTVLIYGMAHSALLKRHNELIEDLKRLRVKARRRQWRRDNRIGIDTGAFASGRLICLVLEGTGCETLSS